MTDWLTKTDMTDWLTKTELLHNPLQFWLYAAASALIGYLLVTTALRIATARLQKLQLRTTMRASETVRTTALALLQGTRRWLIFLLALVIAARFLTLKPHATTILGHAGFVLIGVQIVLWVNALIKLWLRRTQTRAGETAVNLVLVGMLSWAAQIVVWAIFLMAFLANMNFDITALVASLGVGGIAVALALQNVLVDLFSSVAIGLDKPFVVGEFIAFNNVLGTVDHVGVKTTRINSLSGEQLVISNSNLLKELIHNYSRMPQRRIVFGFRIPYSTPSAKVQVIVEKTREFIDAEKQARLDRGHFIAFGEYGFDFEFVYYVLSSNYTLYRDIQQRVNFMIMALLEALDVRFAVPVRQLHPSTSAGFTDPEIASQPPL